MEAVPSESVQLVSVPQRASLARERVRLSTHLTILFDVKTRLSHRGEKLRLVFVDLHISEYVVYETGESRGCLGTDDADASDKVAVHGTLDEAEDCLRYLFVQSYNYSTKVSTRPCQNKQKDFKMTIC